MKSSKNNQQLQSWQYDDYLQLLALKTHLPNAILCHGQSLVGSDKLANAIISSFLCLNPNIDNTACNKCQSCTLYAHGSHPDVYVLKPEDEENHISIQLVRLMTEFLALSSHYGSYKIVLLPDTNLLNLNSANALLKNLEEANSNSLFILFTSNLAKVLPTIISRCHKFKLSLYPTQSTDAHNELNPQNLDKLIGILSHPSITNIFSLGSELINDKEISFKCLLTICNRWLSALLSYKLQAPVNYFTEYSQTFDQLSNKLSIDRIFYLYDKLIFLSTYATHPLNYKLQWENFLLQYQQVFNNT